MKTKPTKPSAPVDGAFLRALQCYRNGEVLSELSDALRRVSEAVASAKKPGSITLRVTVSPSGEAYAYAPEVSVKLPREQKPAAIFFLDAGFNLVREDPNQQSLPLRSIDGGAVAEETEPLKKAEAV